MEDRMKQKILRNIAIVSAIFIVTFSIMLITNYFQVRGVTPLQTEVIETLKEINDENANNPVLQDQIRQLDLLARKAYFTRMDHLLNGVYILLGMLAIFIICTRLYYAKDKDIPDKEIDPIDEWAIKTKARKYIVWATTGLAAVALIFVLLSSPFMKQTKPAKTELYIGLQTHEAANNDGVIAGTSDSSGSNSISVNETEAMPDLVNDGSDATGVNKVNDTTADNQTSQASEIAVSAEATAATPVETTPQPVVSKVTHNAFRGNNSSGVSAAKGLPVKWDLKSGANIAWRQDIPRKGYNSPVINGNKVFFSGADEQARELFCYDLTTGEQLWSLVAANIPGSPAKAPETTEDTGLAASGVATDGNKVCAIFGTGDIICADMDGNQIWAKNLGVPAISYGHSSSLLIYGNMVIVQYDHQKIAKVFALDLATGAERWSKTRNEKGGSWSSPMIAYINNAPQLILVATPGVTAYNPNNGEQLWRVEGMSGEVAASACSVNGIVFVSSEHAKTLAINGTDGSVLWESHDCLPEVASPVATKDNLYIATVYGIVASFDTQTGDLRKEHELAGSSFYSSPVIADGKIYLGDMDGKMFIFSADEEFRLINSFNTGESICATPAFTDGKILIKTEKSIYCVVNN